MDRGGGSIEGTTLGSEDLDAMECERVIKPEDVLTILLFSNSFDLEYRVGLFLDLGLDLVVVVE